MVIPNFNYISIFLFLTSYLIILNIDLCIFDIYFFDYNSLFVVNSWILHTGFVFCIAYWFFFSFLNFLLFSF